MPENVASSSAMIERKVAFSGPSGVGLSHEAHTLKIAIAANAFTKNFFIEIVSLIVYNFCYFSFVVVSAFDYVYTIL